MGEPLPRPSGGPLPRTKPAPPPPPADPDLIDLTSLADAPRPTGTAAPSAGGGSGPREDGPRDDAPREEAPPRAAEPARPRARRPDLNVWLPVELPIGQMRAGRVVEASCSTLSRCVRCDGSGRDPGDPLRGQLLVVGRPECQTCHGTGRTTVERQVKARLPRGVTHGTVLRVPGQGSESRLGTARGDVYLTVVPPGAPDGASADPSARGST
jgi:DnaJ-class molecular chaperone